ncbi:chemotaxis protein [Paenibacillus oryzisoli]|uniref:Glucanase n=1 Tax=Paenibacillus oryzisoli TaxID=1850517 RepID=A0A198A4X0_9BACL|nr:chemotaxis protein [Paenibacillus oryzisoli]
MDEIRVRPVKNRRNKWSIAVICVTLFMAPLLSPAFEQSAHAAGEQKPFPQQVNYPGIIKPDHITQTQMNADVAAYYTSWKSSYLKNNLSSLPGGYYVKGEITGDTDGYVPLGSSEGQGYGMVITALMAGYDENAKTIYDGLFKTARAYKSVQNANLMGWVVADNTGAQGHFDSATDGDMDIAYSLILAHYQWGSAGTINYLAEAQKMITDGIKVSNVTTNNRLNLGDWDGKSVLNTRPSDWMLSHLRAYYDVTGDQTWLNVINNLYSVYSSFSTSYSPSTGLISDFVVGNPPQPAPTNYLDEFPETNEYNYNAARVPLRIVMDYALYGDVRGKTIADKMAVWIKAKTGGNPNNVKDGYKLDGTVTGSASGPAGVFVSPFIAAAVTNSSHQAWINAGWDWMKSHKTGYYDESYTLLNMLFISGNWWKPVAGGTTDTQSPTAPTNLTASPVSGSQIDLSWAASTDNVGVTGYDVFRGAALVGSSTTTSFTDTGLTASTTYSYTVKAKDAASNVSAASNTISATTLAAGGNLALGKTYSASTIWNASYPAANAFDGDISNTSRWSASNGSLNNQWISIDFGAAATFNQVVMKEITFQRVTSYKLQFSNDGTSYSDIAGTSGTAIGASQTVNFSQVTSRYLRLYINTASAVPTINEMEVYN